MIAAIKGQAQLDSELSSPTSDVRPPHPSTSAPALRTKAKPQVRCTCGAESDPRPQSSVDRATQVSTDDRKHRVLTADAVLAKLGSEKAEARPTKKSLSKQTQATQKEIMREILESKMKRYRGEGEPVKYMYVPVPQAEGMTSKKLSSKHGPAEDHNLYKVGEPPRDMHEDLELSSEVMLLV